MRTILNTFWFCFGVILLFGRRLPQILSAPTVIKLLGLSFLAAPLLLTLTWALGTLMGIGGLAA